MAKPTSDKTLIKVFMIFFVTLITEYVVTIPKSLTDVYQIPSYVMRYQDVGFINRGLIGTLTRLIYGDVINNKDILSISMIAMVSIIVIISYIFAKMYVNYIDTEYCNIVVILIMLYWILPVGWHAYYQGSFMIHLEVYIVLLNLICFIVHWKVKSINVKFSIYAFVSIIAMLIHTNYMFMGYPFVMFFIVTDFYGQNKKKTYIFKALFLTIFVCVFFLFVQFSSTICMSFDETTMYVKSHYSGYDIDSVLTGEEWDYRPWYHLMLYNYYFSDFFGCLKENLQIYYKSMIIGGIETIIIVCPIIGFLVKSIKKIMLSESTELKVSIIAGYVLSICFLPLFILTVDYGRWFTLLFMYFAMVYFSVLYKYKLKLEECGYLEWLKKFIEKRKLSIVCLVIVYYAIGKIDLIDLWPRINEVYTELKIFFM